MFTKNKKLNINNTAFVTRLITLATLPHSKSKSFEFERRNGHYSLSLVANPRFGLPSGSIPRLILIWIITEAVTKRTREIRLGKSLSIFLKKLGLQNNGGKRGDATRLKDQIMRLLTCSISCTYNDVARGLFEAHQFHISSCFQLLWCSNTEENQGQEYNYRITLSESFYNELVKSTIPIDLKTLQVLRRSPLQIDIYIWLTYRFSNLKRNSAIKWQQLRNQFGCCYQNVDGYTNFKRKFLIALKKVMLVYPDAVVVIEQNELILCPSPTHVMRKNRVDKAVN